MFYGVYIYSLAQNPGSGEADLALLVDEGLEVLLLAQDGLGDEVQVVDAYCGQQGRTLGVRQPRDLGGLLKVGVLQVQTSLQ